MKKITLLLLCVSLVLLCASCNKNSADDDGKNTASDTVSDSTYVTEDDSTAAPDAPSAPIEYEYDGYKKLTVKAHGKWKSVHFGYEGEEQILKISVPLGWDFNKMMDTVYIYDGNNKIGDLVQGVPTLKKDAKVMEEKEQTVGNTVCIERIISVPVNSKSPDCEYLRSYTYKYTDRGEPRALTLSISYAELNDRASDKLVSDADSVSKFSDPYIGALKLDKAGEKKILVLGNSFISSSKIGSFLQTMFENTEYNVTAISRGMASVSAGSWEDYLGVMESGSYDMVFMCGFYSESDSVSLKPYVDSCKKSGTELVIFPAHNETGENFAASAYPELFVLNWKGEINNLMEKYDIGYWDFCVDDQHKHSKPLAGYVGAHMIYRALTGELPPDGREYTGMPRAELESYLGDYMTKDATTAITQSIWLFD